MSILKRSTACLVAFALLFIVGCATAAPEKAPKVIPAEKQVLPAGHPPVKKGKTAKGFRNIQAEAYASYIYALMLADEGRSRDAIGYLQMAAQLDSTSPRILDDLMGIYVGEGMHAEAEETARKILEIDPQWANAHVQLGQIYLDMDRPIDAVNHLQIAVELDPERKNILFYLADALERTGDIEAAIASLQELKLSEDHGAIAYYYISRLHLRAGDTGSAVDSFTKAVELNPSFIKEIEEMAGFLENSDRKEDLFQFYEGYLDKDPENIHVRELLARALIREERYEEAKTQTEIILEKAPDNLSVRLLKGLIEAHGENYDAALETFSRVRSSAPDNFDLILQIGVLQRQLEMYEDAIATFKDASEIAPNRYEPYLNLSIAYDMTEDVDNAIESARSALALEPDRDNIRNYLAQLLIKKNLYEESEDVIRQGLLKKPDDTGFLYQLAIIYDRTDRFDLAVDILKRIIELNPRHYDAMNYLGYSWADRGMNLDESLTLVEKALEIKPDAAYIIDSLGWVYYRMARYEEALEQLLEAGQLMEDDPTVLEHIGDTYDKLGNKDLAIKYWSLTLKADPDNSSVLEKLKEKGVIETTP